MENKQLQGQRVLYQVRPCSLVEIYRRLEGLCSLHAQDREVSRFLRNVLKFPPHYMPSYPRKQHSSVTAARNTSLALIRFSGEWQVQLQRQVNRHHYTSTKPTVKSRSSFYCKQLNRNVACMRSQTGKEFCTIKTK
jgi:hypothetical protein